MDQLLLAHGRLTIVHGAARRGADAVASAWARAHADAVEEEPHPADWHRYGRAAGPLRNWKMVETGADLCLAFIHHGSRGATHCARAAERAGIPTIRHVSPPVPSYKSREWHDLADDDPRKLRAVYSAADCWHAELERRTAVDDGPCGSPRCRGCSQRIRTGRRVWTYLRHTHTRGTR